MKRRKQRRKLWKAIQEAAGNEPGSCYVKPVHPIWGMRAIRDFEKINGVQFDPSNSLHTMTTFHKGRAKLGLVHLRNMAVALSKFGVRAP